MNGKSDGFKTVQGSVVAYTCDTGFAFQDNKLIQTTVCDGQTWNPLVNDCRGKGYSKTIGRIFLMHD